MFLEDKGIFKCSTSHWSIFNFFSQTWNCFIPHGERLSFRQFRLRYSNFVRIFLGFRQRTQRLCWRSVFFVLFVFCSFFCMLYLYFIILFRWNQKFGIDNQGNTLPVLDQPKRNVTFVRRTFLLIVQKVLLIIEIVVTVQQPGKDLMSQRLSFQTQTDKNEAQLRNYLKTWSGKW